MTDSIHILYVDDDSEVADEISTTVENELSALSVTTRATAEDALDYLSTGPPDCIVADYDLPDTDGVALLEEVREAFPNLPFVLVTDRESESIVREAYSAGVTDYLPKSGLRQQISLAYRIEEAVTNYRTKRSLDQRERHHQALMESASDVIITMDEESTITSVNNASEELFGYESEELVGESLTKLMTEENGRRHFEAVDRYLRTGERKLDWSYLELPGKHRDGHEIPLGVSFGEYEHDGTHYFSGLIRDISQRKEAENELRRERNLKNQIVETSPVGIALLDSSGELTFANSRAEEILGITADENGSWSVAAFDVIDRDGNPVPGEEFPFRRIVATGEPIFNEELGVRRPGGEVVWLSLNGAPIRRDEGEVIEVITTFSDITEQVELESEREETLERVTDAFFALDQEWNFTYLNERARALIAPDGRELLGKNIWEEFSAAVDSVFEENYRDAMEHQETVSFEAYYPDPLDGWFNVSAYPSETGLSVYFRDITERKRREKRLESLHETSQRLTELQTREEVSDAAVAAATETLDLPITAVQLYDDESGRLRSISQTNTVTELVGDGTLFDEEADLPWQVYIEQRQSVYPDLLSETELSESNTPLRSVILLPLGEYGVFITGSTSTDAFSDADAHLARILVGNTISALGRVDREQELREQRNTLEARNTMLERVRRVNGIIRGITQDLIQASTREEMRVATCERLTTTDPYRFAWIGTYDASTGEIEPVASPGDENGSMDVIAASLEEGPAERAARTKETQVENAISSHPPFEPWQQAALQQGYQSVIAIPLVYQDSLFGVLTLYADQTGMFTEMEETVFTELGETIGYAINALERKEALVSDTSVELEFQVRDPDDTLLAFLYEQNSEFEFVSVVPGANEKLSIFFNVRGGAPSEVLAFGERVDIFDDIWIVTEEAEESLFGGTLSRSAFLSTLVSRGATPKAITATGGEGQFVISVAKSANVRTFVELFDAQYDEVELTARRSVDEPIRTQHGFEAEFESKLTERQREVIRTAFVSGFFESPRRTTAQDLAEMLGVSQPTVSRHIRGGERKLFELIFDTA